MLDTLTQNAVALALAVAFCFTVTGVGLLVLKRLPATFASPWESLVISFGIGAGLTGVAVFALAAGQLLYPTALALFSILLLAVAAAGWRGTKLALSLTDLRPRGMVETASALLLLTLLAAALLLSLTPETGKDALIYHLAAPKIFLQHHGFRFIPGNPLAHGPFQTEMLFLLALFLKGEILAKLVNFAFFLALLLLIRQFAGVIPEPNDFPWLSMLIFAAIPTVFIETHAAYIDLATAFAVLSALYSFIVWHGRRERGWLLLCAFFTGVALASKLTTLIVPFTGVLGVLWVHRDNENGGEALRDLALFLLVTLLFGAPHYVKNWLLTGNPFYPFLYGMFGGRGWEQEQARLFDAWVLFFGMGRTPLDYLLLPWNLSIHARPDTGQFDGYIGPVFLILLPFLAGVKKPSFAARSVMVFSLLLFLFWASASQQLRFLIPILPLMAFLSGIVLTRYREQRGIALLLAAATAGCLMVNCRYDLGEFRKYSPLRVATGLESRDAYLERTLSPYRMYRFVNTDIPRDARVWCIFMKNWTFLCERDCFSDYMFEYYTLQKILASSATPEDVARQVKEMGFTHMMYDVNYITGEKSMLTPEEQALFTAYREKYLTLVKNDRYYYLYRL